MRNLFGFFGRPGSTNEETPNFVLRIRATQNPFLTFVILPR